VVIHHHRGLPPARANVPIRVHHRSALRYEFNPPQREWIAARILAHCDQVCLLARLHGSDIVVQPDGPCRMASARCYRRVGSMRRGRELDRRQIAPAVRRETIPDRIGSGRIADSGPATGMQRA
jgi:hypothetical protein